MGYMGHHPCWFGDVRGVEGLTGMGWGNGMGMYPETVPGDLGGLAVIEEYFGAVSGVVLVGGMVFTVLAVGPGRGWGDLHVRDPGVISSALGVGREGEVVECMG